MQWIRVRYLSPTEEGNPARLALHSSAIRRTVPYDYSMEWIEQATALAKDATTKLGWTGAFCAIQTTPCEIYFAPSWNVFTV